MVGIALAAPSGGQSLTWFGGAELLFATNQLLSGAADALDGSDENRNLMREGSRAVGGETGVKVYDVTEIGTIFFGSGNSFNRILKTTRKQEKIKEGSSLVKSTFDVYQLNIKPLVDE